MEGAHLDVQPIHEEAAEALARDADARVRGDAVAFGAILEVEEEEIASEAFADGGGVDEGFGEAGEEVGGEEGFKVGESPVDGEAPAGSAVSGVWVALIDTEWEWCGWGVGGVALTEGLGEDESRDAGADDEGVWRGGGHCAG